MSDSFTSSIAIQDLPLWATLKARQALLNFVIETTARCNNNCRHCYINRPAGDRAAAAQELSPAEIDRIADEAIAMGAVWCLVTGGEPLLRPDFAETYLLLKRKGLLVSVFTTATLVNDNHITLFKRYPPRDIEVTVYGVTRETYESITRRPGSFAAFQRGLDRLLQGGIKVRLKAMALRSNLHEMPAIAAFCEERTKDYFRFDPLLHLRLDGDAGRNAEIAAERLTPEEIVALERSDARRFQALRSDCATLINPRFSETTGNQLFYCGTGDGSFNVGYDGTFRLCASLAAPGTTYDLRRGTLREAWAKHVPAVRGLRSDRPSFLQNCARCPVINLCLWCPAHAHLETGELDAPTPYFCAVAHARAAMLQEDGAAPRPTAG